MFDTSLIIEGKVLEIGLFSHQQCTNAHFLETSMTLEIGFNISWVDRTRKASALFSYSVSVRGSKFVSRRHPIICILTFSNFFLIDWSFFLELYTTLYVKRILILCKYFSHLLFVFCCFVYGIWHICRDFWGFFLSSRNYKSCPLSLLPLPVSLGKASLC